MTLPVIGLTLSRIPRKNLNSVLSITEAYVQAVSRAGAAPLLIPSGLADEAYPPVLSRLDGLLFTGGGDVAPELYGSSPHPRVDEVDPDRDRVELALLAEATRRGLPFLGICRGLQLINVALGGTLYEDIHDQHPGAIRHDWYPDIPRDHLAHTVRVGGSTRLAQVLGQAEVQVNSLHHQGIRQVAPPLQATTYAPDGIVEAVELPGYPFGLAVQWHPEWLQEHAIMRELFRSFVRAAQEHR